MNCKSGDRKERNGTKSKIDAHLVKEVLTFSWRTREEKLKKRSWAWYACFFSKKELGEESKKGTWRERDVLFFFKVSLLTYGALSVFTLIFQREKNHAWGWERCKLTSCRCVSRRESEDDRLLFFFSTPSLSLRFSTKQMGMFFAPKKWGCFSPPKNGDEW